MEELMDALEGATGVKKISYDKSNGCWLVEYNYDVDPDLIKSSLLIDFLNNG